MGIIFLKYLFNGTTWEFTNVDEVIYTNRWGDKFNIFINKDSNFGPPFMIQLLEKGKGRNEDYLR